MQQNEMREKINKTQTHTDQAKINVQLILLILVYLKRNTRTSLVPYAVQN